MSKPKNSWYVNGLNIAQAPLCNLKHVGFFATEEEARAEAIKRIAKRIGELEKSMAFCREALGDLLITVDRYGETIRVFGEVNNAGK